MNPTSIQAIHFLIALSALLAATFAGRIAFAAARQPPVIGEVAAGVVLGPSLLGWLFPSAERWLFHGDALTPAGLGGLSELGLLALVFLAGAQMHGFVLSRVERRTVISVAVAGIVVSFACGSCIALVAGIDTFSGPHGSTTTIVLVLGLAAAINGVPVIGRILMDLDIAGTAFGRMVLAVALAEDVVLFVVLAVVLGLGESGHSQCCGVWTATGITSIPASAAYFAVAPVVVLLLVMAVGRPLVNRMKETPRYAAQLRGSFVLRLGAALVGGLLALGLGIDPLFGAFAAGLCLGPDDGGFTETASSFLVPVYLAMLGLHVDLAHQVDWWFMGWFLVLAVVAKALGVVIRGWVVPLPRRLATDIAAATNCGPAVLIASTTFTAGIINAKLFTALVLLLLVASQGVGAYLGWGVRSGRLQTAAGLAAIRDVNAGLEQDADRDADTNADTGLPATATAGPPASQTREPV
jgi:Kef-type K+ transport system membrane component KefB